MSCIKTRHKCKIRCPVSVKILSGNFMSSKLFLQLGFDPFDVICKDTRIPKVAFLKFTGLDSIFESPISCSGLIEVNLPSGVTEGPILIAVSPCCPILQTTLTIPSSCLVNPICSATFCTITCDTPSSGIVRVVSANCPTACVIVSPSLCYTTIQAAVNASGPGDTIIVCPGTYIEQVTIPAGKNGLIIKSQTPGTAIIQAPSTLNLFVASPGIVTIRSLCVSFQNFTVQGSAIFSSCVGEFFGIVVDSGGTAIISGNTVTNIRDSNPALNGCQRGRAIAVEPGSSAIITNNTVSNYQKTGIRIRGTGACARITGNTATGTGFNPLNLAANNGIQVQQGATASLNGNVTTNHIYAIAPTVSAGILIFSTAGPVCVQNNNTSSNQVGIALAGTSTAGTSNIQVTSNISDDNHTSSSVTPINNFGFGIFVDQFSTGNIINLNTALHNSTFDAEDDSTGTESCCTGNEWLCNICASDNRSGCICKSTTTTCATKLITITAIVFSP